MKMIYVASPYAGDIEKNVAFAKECCSFVMQSGHGWFAPHLTYTQILDDTVPEQRKQGLEMGLTMLDRCDELWYFGETISQGMGMELEFAQSQGIPVRNVSTIEMRAQHEEMTQSPIPEMAVC